MVDTWFLPGHLDDGTMLLDLFSDGLCLCLRCFLLVDVTMFTSVLNGNIWVVY